MLRLASCSVFDRAVTGRGRGHNGAPRIWRRIGANVNARDVIRVSLFHVT